MQKRYREQRSTSTASWSATVRDGTGKVTSTPSGSSSIFTIYNGMNDVTGGGKTEKPVRHIKSETLIGNQTGTCSHSSFGSITLSGSRALESDLPFVGAAMTTAEVENLASDFLGRIKDPLSSSLSLANYLIELRDLKRTFSFLKDRLDKAISGGFLSYNFGLKPFIDDSIALAQSFGKLLARLEYLRKNNGVPIKITAFRSFTRPGTPLTLPPFNSTAAGTTSWKQTWTKETTLTVQCWAIIVYDTSALQGYGGLMRAIASFYGFDKPASVAWNAIPLSFVVDWFTNLGSVFDSLTIVPELPRKVLRAGYWTKSEGVTYVSGGHVSDISRSNLTFATRKWKIYDRYPGMLPVGVTYLNGLSDLSVKQMALGLSLIHQRWVSRTHQPTF